jgi:hypothetical protein
VVTMGPDSAENGGGKPPHSLPGVSDPPSTRHRPSLSPASPQHHTALELEPPPPPPSPPAPAAAAPGGAPVVGYRAIFRAWALLGWTAFGGPAAHIGIFSNLFVGASAACRTSNISCPSLLQSALF